MNVEKEHLFKIMDKYEKAIYDSKNDKKVISLVFDNLKNDVSKYNDMILKVKWGKEELFSLIVIVLSMTLYVMYFTVKIIGQ